MSTVIRNEVSKKNPYYLSKHRTLELKHFCMQYEEWRKERAKISVLQSYEYGKIPGKKISDKTGNLAVRAATLDGYMGAVVSCCKEADSYIWSWLLEGVTEGVGYEILRARGLPCGKDYYYERYRKFFWLLDKVR